MTLCRICKLNDATKTNSHLLPAFLEAIVGSYDHSYKRDKDILITKTPYETKIHVGAIPSDENDRLFDQDELTDERIKTELAVNPCAMDYIFCPDCESLLSIHLEAPYSHDLKGQNAVDGHLAYFFWISVIWRMSIGKSFGFRLPENVEKQLGESLNNYLKVAKDDLDGINSIIEATPFCYKLFHCKNYCKDPNNGGFIHCWLSDSKKSITCILGDYGIEVCFSREFQSEAPKYFLNKRLIDFAPINTGLTGEQRQSVEQSVWTQTHKDFIQATKRKILDGHLEFLQQIWKKLKKEGNIISDGDMPPQMAFWIIEKMYSGAGVKFGDKFTIKRWYDVIVEALEHPDYWAHT